MTPARLGARLAVPVLVLAGVLGGTGAGASPGPGPGTGARASAGADVAVAAACGAGPGVTVVVDYGPHGGIDVGCSVADPPTGLDALEQAGFDWEGTAQFWSFVCRINGLPTPDDDQCVRTPPADAYWSYWTAVRGGGWQYGGTGAGSADPAPGSVQGWAFGAGAAPGTAPPPPVEQPTTPPPPPPTSTVPADPPSTPTDPGDDEPDAPGGTDAPVTTPVAPTSTTAAPTGPTTAPTTTAGTSASSSADPADASVPPSGPAGATVAGPGAGSSPVGTVVGLGAVGALAVVGALVLRRRRAAAADPQ